MPFIIHSDESHRFYYGMESTFGTALGLSAATKELVIERGQFVDLGIGKTFLDLNRQSRIPTIGNFFHDNFTGPVGLGFNSYGTKDRLADLLYLVTQNRVSQGAVGTGHQKIFRPHASQPDFTLNAGAFATGIWKSPAGLDVRLTSGILRELSLTFQKGAAGEANLIKVGGMWLFKKYELPVTYTGMPAVQDISLAYRAHAFVLSIGSMSINPANWSRFTLNIRNNAVGIERDSSGNPVTYFLNPGENALTVSGEFWYNTTYGLALTHFAAGTTFTFGLSTGTINTDGYINITGNGKFFPGTTPAATENQIRMPFEATLGNTVDGATDALDFTIADAISQT